MSLCPSSSHQLIAAAIAFRRARRKFPKDYGLENITDRAAESTKVEIATSREGPINQVRSSSALVKRAYNSRFDHVCQMSVRGHVYDRSRGAENPISCSCCRTRHGENIAELRHECSGGDAIDTVPSRECEEFATLGGDKNEFVKSVERDRCDAASTAADEAGKTVEWNSRSARSTFYHHRKARCSSRPCSSSGVANLAYDASRERCDKVACGDSSEDKDSAPPSSRHGTSIDFNLEERVATNDACISRGGSEDAWIKKLDSPTPRREIVDSAWRYQREFHPHEETAAADLTRSCEHCCDRYHHHRNHPGCFHRRCCCHDSSSADAKGCEYSRIRHKSWREPARDESVRLYARHCRSKDFEIISAVREDVRRENDDEDDDDDDGDNDNVGVINHKDSMCILAEKYKAGKKCRDGERCGERTGSSSRTNEDDKSLTSEIIDQPEAFESSDVVSREGPKHVCRAHCGSCGTAIATSCRECKQTSPEAEFERLKTPLCETAVDRCCSRAASYRRAF